MLIIAEWIRLLLTECQSESPTCTAAAGGAAQQSRLTLQCLLLCTTVQYCTIWSIPHRPQQCSESIHRPQQVDYQSRGITSDTGPHSKMLKNNKTFILSTKFIFSWILSQDDNVSNFIVYMALKSLVIEVFWRYSKNVYSSSEPLDPVPKKGVTDTAPVRAVPK